MNNSKAGIAVQPLQWSALANIDHVRRIDDEDTECLEAVRAVLEKHDCLDRFGLTLLHSHFELGDDEILLETTDVAKREQLVRPVKKSEIEKAGMNAQTTVLRFDNKSWSQHCGCFFNVHGHTGSHSS